MLEVWCELVCGQCAKSGPGQHGYQDRIARKQLKQRAEREGWQFIDDLPFCCVACKTKFENGE